MRTIIVENEKPILELMKLMMERNEYLEVVGEYTDSKEALNFQGK
ncbi:hypothetical protein [uncultured Clostridium sp.]|jgi:two-component SAPR family response regulator|nr:hypothetical protein [uncultured Clostridium sp.]